MPCAMRSSAIFGAKVCQTSTGRMLTPRIDDVYVSKWGTMLLAMAWSSTCGTKCRLLVAPLRLTPFSLVVFISSLLTVRSAESWPSADGAMCWMFLTPTDLAPPIHNINAALGRVLFAIHAFRPHMAKGCTLLTVRLDAVARHLSALITDQGNIPDIFTRLPRKN